ncbi:restriction endonuclease subunit S [Candidatus Poseidoniaceae archaeon]|nr:restriction endonuclease subunit S [Candidatus Poseidoniaceae archaeon]
MSSQNSVLAEKRFREVRICDVIKPLTTINPSNQPDVEIEYIDVSSVNRDTLLIQQTSILLGSEAPSRARRLVHTGDVIFATVRPTLKRITVVPETLDGAVCSTGYFVLRPTDEVLSRYLFYYLQSQRFSNEMESLQRGASYPAVSDKDVKEHIMLLPSLSEQQRIIRILDEAFKEINGNIKSTESSLIDFPEIFQSKLHEIYSNGGSDWSDYTLAEVSLDFGRGKSKHRPRNYKPLYDGPYPFVQTGDVRSSNHFISEYTQTYSEMGLAQSKLWPKGTICITIAANIAETAILDFDACFPDSVIGVVVNPEITINEYVEYALQFFKTKLQKEGKGSAQDNINMGTFKELKFPFAPLNEQKKIVDLLNILNEQTMMSMNSQQKKIQNLEELKQSILQEAFNGTL